jgi:hypothetical protein
MSFRRYVYYCAVCGGCAAYAGWALGRVLPFESGLVLASVRGLLLGLTVAAALGAVDALWNLAVADARRIAARAALSGTVGAVGGWLGAALGEALYDWQHIGALAVFGWVCAGFIIGAAAGAFDVAARLVRRKRTGGTLRKPLNAAAGGAIGGLLGGAVLRLLQALCYRFVVEDTETFWSPSAWGFVALGLCIGLGAGLAQVLLREAWVRVEEGAHGGRELVLWKDVVTVGRSEICDIGLPAEVGVEPLHARLLRRGGRYVIEDVGRPEGTLVNEQRVTEPAPLRDGDAIMLGKCVLRFGERTPKPHERSGA